MATNFDALVQQAMDQATDTQTKIDTIADLAPQKQAAVLSKSQAYQLGASMLHQSLFDGLNTSGSNADTPVMADARNLNPLELDLKYGSQAPGIISSQVQGVTDYRNDAEQTRTPAQIVGDSINSLLGGAATSAAAIPVLGAGLLDKGLTAAGYNPTGLGVEGALGLGKFTDFTNSLQSDAGQAQRRAAQAVVNNDVNDDGATFEKTDPDNSSLGSYILNEASRIGKDTIKATADTLSDPNAALDAVASGAGTLVSAGPIASVTRHIGEAALSDLTKIGAVDAAGSASKILDRAIAPTSLGLLGGSGAYNDTAQEAYAKLADRPDLSENQKLKMANDAAITAATIAAPTTAITGELTGAGDIETHVPHAAGFKDALNHSLIEGGQEAIRASIGKVGGNIGIAQNVDPNQDIGDGVGEALGKGFIGGFGSGVATQVPAATFHEAIALPKTALTAVGKAADYALQPVYKAADALMARNAAQNPVDESQMRPVVDAAIQTAPATQAVVQTAIDGADTTPAQKTQANAYVSKLYNTIGFNPDELSTAPDHVQAVVSNSSDRLDAINKLATAINDSSNTQEQLDYASGLRTISQPISDLVHTDVGALKEVAPDDDAHNQVNQLTQTVASLDRDPKVASALSKADSLLTKDQMVSELNKPLTNEEVSTPQGQNKINNIVQLAQVAPEKLSTNAAQTVLNMVKSGKITLTDAQINALQAAGPLYEAQQAIDKSTAQNQLTTSQTVSSEIHDANDDDQVIAGAKSVSSHIAGIRAAMDAGNHEVAQTRLGRFRDFAQSMQNKVEAINNHFNNPEQGTQHYQTYVPSEDAFFKSGTKVGVTRTNENSVAAVQRIGIDAHATGLAYNRLNSKLNGSEAKDVKLVPLHEELTGKSAKDIAQGFKDAKANEAQPTQEEAKPVSEPTKEEPVEEETKQEESPVQEPVKETDPVTEALDEAIDKPVETEKPTTVDKLYPNLLNGNKIKNIFKRAFKMPAVDTSRLIGSEQPVAHIAEILKDSTSFGSVVKPAIASRLTTSVALDYRQYLSQAKGLYEVMEANLQKFITKRGAQIEEGKLNRYDNGKALNIVDQNEDGTYNYNPELVQVAILAGMQFVLNGKMTAATLDDDDVRRIFSIPRELDVPAGLAGQLNTGLYTEAAVNELARKIQAYWGFNTRKTASPGDSLGIAQAVAAEVMRALIDKGLMNMVANEQLKDIGLNKTINIFQFNQTADDSGLTKFRDAIDRAVLVKPEVQYQVGEPITDIQTTQLRNPQVSITKQQAQMLETEQKSPHFINSKVVSAFESLGLDNILKIFGAGNLEDKKLNKQHAASLAGKNLSISQAWDTIFNTIIPAVQHEADVTGKDLSEVPSYYGYGMNRLNRMQMMGLNNPQVNKLTREAQLPTVATVDLTDAKMRSNYNLALAQMLGIKVHAETRDSSYAKLIDKLDSEPFTKVVDALKDHLKTGKALTNANADDMADLGLSVAGLHALIDYANMRNQTTKELKKYTTQVYVEADGMTNGPANAMQLINSGNFDEENLSNLARVGYYLTPNTTANSYRTGTDSSDLYQALAKKLQVLLNKNAQSFPDNIREQNTALTNLFNQFLPGFSASYNDDGSVKDITIDRGVTKNPLTITIYGSGANGIAGNIAGELVNAIYAQMSSALQSHAADEGSLAEGMFPEASDHTEANAQASQMADALTKLLGSNIFVDRNGKMALGKAKTDFDVSKLKNFENFKVEPEQMKTLIKNIEHLFVNPLVSTIADTVGEQTMGNSKLIQQATNAQSILRQYLFQQKVDEVRAEKAKDPNYVKQDFIPQNELDAIQAEILKLVPMISTLTQNLLVQGRGSYNLGKNDPLHFGSGFNEFMQTDAQINAPGPSGVAGSPLTVVSNGDGQMIQNIFTNPEAPTKRLGIFDGVHWAIDGLDEGGLASNKGVWDSWMGNPMQNISDSYNQFLKAVPDIMDDSLKADLAKALGDENVFNALEGLGQTLSNEAKIIAAKHAVMAKVVSSIDQMAAIGQSHQNEGIDLSEMEPAEQVKTLNQMLNDELNGTNKEEISEPKTTPKTSLGRIDKSGARVLSKNSLRQILGSKEITLENKQILRDILRSTSTKDFRMVTGTVEQLQAYAQRMGDNIPDITGQDGFTLMSDRAIYLPNASTETLVHELVHAATFDKVNAYYNGEETDPFTKDAITRTEALMNQFMSLNAEDIDPKALDTYNEVSSQIADALQNDNKAVALNEFMAWSLSNQNLINQLQGTKTNTLGSIAKNIIQSLKRVIFGRKWVSKPADDMFTNLRFNARILMNASPSVQTLYNNNVLFQNRLYGNNDRLTGIDDNISRMIVQYLDNDETGRYVRTEGERINRKKDITFGIQTATKAALHVSSNFNMNMQESSTFRSIVGILATQAQLDPNSMVRINDLYEHVIKNLNIESFMADRESQDPNDLAQSQEKFNTILGKNYLDSDSNGRTTLLPIFLGLATVNDQFRDILSKMPPAMDELKYDGTLDTYLENVGTSMLNKLNRTLSGEGKTASVQQSIDNLLDHVIEVAQDRQGFIQNFASSTGNAIDKANDWVAKILQVASTAVIDKASEVAEGTDNKIVKTGALFTQALAAVASEQNAGAVAEGIQSAMNNTRLPQFLKDLVNDAIGMTDSNKNVYVMIKKIAAQISAMRQQFREQVPAIIASKFSRELTSQEWTDLHKTMARGDLAALQSGFTNNEVLQHIADPKTRADAISKLEDDLFDDSKRSSMVQDKAKQLANYMNTKQFGHNLLTNAYAVASLFGTKEFNKPTDAYVEKLDHLISLYALDSLDKNTLDSVSSLVQSEAPGLNFALSYLQGQRVEEMRKVNSSIMARINSFKGWIPEEAEYGKSLVVGTIEQHRQLIEQSYQQVALYKGSGANPIRSNRSYYYLPVSSKAPFSQGILQNVRMTASGVDIRNGISKGMLTAGTITDRDHVEAIEASMNREGSNITENLRPVYGPNGRATAYEETFDPAQLTRLNYNTNLSQMIGNWRGRQAEELSAETHNETLIDQLKAMYDKDNLAGRGNEYIDLNAPTKDKVLQDAVSLFTPMTRSYINKVFGDKFYVRKDMLNDSFGYRNASVGDAWTGNSRWSPETLLKVKKLAIGVFGNDAYRYLLTGEKFIQNVVADAKSAIVVKSVVVPISNLISNIYQMVARGIPLANILSGMPKKTAEVDSYVKSRIRQIEIEAELRANPNPTDILRLQAEHDVIGDAHRRLSIWPLIEANELSSISDNARVEDIELSEGKLQQYVESLVHKLPEGLQTAGRYAYITKDTALFKGLQRAVEYGDFLAKAILYDDLTNRKKLTKEQALRRVTEEYVNYDKLPGRDRKYLESVGLMWFWNYKIRSMKVALSMIRNNPVHSLIATLAPVPTMFGNVGLPLKDNLLSMAEGGRLGYSIGPWMGIGTLSMNPWLSMTRSVFN